MSCSATGSCALEWHSCDCVPTPDTCSVSLRCTVLRPFLPAAFASIAPLLTHSPPVRLLTDPGSISSACCPSGSSVLDA